MRHVISTIIFDVDGTLAETEELHRKAFNQAFKDKGLNWHWGIKLYGDLLKIAGGKERLKFYQANFLRPEIPLSDDDISVLHNEKTEIYSNFVKNGSLTLRPGIRSLIENSLKRNISLAISTSTSHSNLLSLIESCFKKKPEDIFCCLSTGDLVKKKKPASDLYDLVIDQMSIDPTECLAVEDSRIGLLAAKSAKIKVLVSPSSYHLTDDFVEADYFCKSFKKEQLPVDIYKLLYNYQ